MNGAQPMRPAPNGAAVNGVSPVRRVIRKKATHNIFSGTNNNKQNRFNNQALKRPSEFKDLDSGDGKQTRPQKPQQRPPNVNIPTLSDRLQEVPEEHRYSGFSDPRLQQPGHAYRDYKLVTTKRELLESLRYHMMQLVGNDNVDIRNGSDFPAPAHLNRRDIMAEMLGPRSSKPEDVKNELDPDQRIELMNRKEQRAKEREANLAQVAPSSKTAKKMNNFKGSEQVYKRGNQTEEQKRMWKTNYEEAIPWVLEDYDNKHTFIGENQLGAYGVHVGFAFEPATETDHARFRLIPVEKVYEFKPKPKIYNTMTDDEIQAALKRGAVDPVWLREFQHKREASVKAEQEDKKARGLYTGTTTRQNYGRTQQKGEDADLDFEEDFADDEEGGLFGDDEDEEEKDTKKKIKDEQLQANLFQDYVDEKEVDADEEREEREAAARKELSKSFRKALEKREGNYNHGSDSDSYTSTDTDEERQRLEQEKLKNVKKEEDAIDGKKSAMSSGANTPSGRREKHGSGREDGPRKSKKRPGSPNLSDASGTDASMARKKKRKSHHPLSSQPTPGPSRPRSPDNLDPTSAASRQSRASFTSNPAGSDTEAGAMSDGARNRKNILKFTNPAAVKKEPGLSPPTSRAVSPIPRPSSTGPPGAMPSVEEIARSVPSEGISYKALFNALPALKAAFKDPAQKAEVMRVVKLAGTTVGGKIYPFGSAPPAPAGAASSG